MPRSAIVITHLVYTMFFSMSNVYMCVYNVVYTCQENPWVKTVLVLSKLSQYQSAGETIKILQRTRTKIYGVPTRPDSTGDDRCVVGTIKIQQWSPTKVSCDWSSPKTLFTRANSDSDGIGPDLDSDRTSRQYSVPLCPDPDRTWCAVRALKTGGYCTLVTENSLIIHMPDPYTPLSGKYTDIIDIWIQITKNTQ